MEVKDPITLIVICGLILITIMVFINVLKNNMTFEKAFMAAIDPRPKKVLKIQEPESNIPEDASCIVETMPAFDFEGKELDNPRGVTCTKCHEYVYKHGDENMCSPYKYRSDNFCIVDTKIKEMCPF